MYSTKSGGVKLWALRDIYAKISERSKRPDLLAQDPVVYSRAYVLYIVGAILFPSSSRDEDVDRPSSFGDEDIEAPVLEAHAREIDIDPSAPVVTQKSPLEVDTSARDAP
ncbi:hypothetical protein POM88_045185 [Heracleum sosnowskyi]|uniref:Uncharacterized protein n=1 Tax=Heracleum sosnowskyi TaxID=360622 RepID=A0AAD8H5H1_9APIA|nr:hypothetical protein POM88_045185 [Heracleum sosnowskyi]